MPAPILRDQIHRQLLSAIISGQIAPGTNLREERIAADLDVSRTPVREALRKLAEEGIVEYYPRRGAKLLRPSAALTREVFQIREALEGAAARCAAPLILPERLAWLRTHFEQIRPRVGAGDATDVGDILHEEIFAACNNRRLQQLMQIHQGQILWLQGFAQSMPERVARAFREHESVLSALEARDPNWAEAAIRAHIRATLEDLLANFDDKHDSRRIRRRTA